MARKRKGLNFHEPGTFIAKGEQLRKRAKLEELQRKIAARAAKTGIAEAAKLASLTTTVDKIHVTTTTTSGPAKELDRARDEVPDVEWWDKPILGGKSLDQVTAKLVQQRVKPEEILQGITNLVEHPPIKPPPGDRTPAPLPIFFTASERKKLRKQTRKIRELDKQEKIKFGLLPKPEPKLKRSNILYALGDEAAVNPSMTEQMVREQEQKRLQAHIEHNESKKVDPLERKLKKARKNEKDLSENGLRVAIYRVAKFERPVPKPKFIVKEARTQRPLLTGAMILYKDINVVIVEGAPKQQKNFRRFILPSARRKEEQDPLVVAMDEVDGGMANPDTCQLVWEGQVSERAFKNFESKQAANEDEARRYFKNFDVEHYWDMALKKSILDSLDNNL